jgi:membrane protein involved in colicin uptake
VIWAALGALVATLVVVAGVRLLPKQKPEPDPDKEETRKLLAELRLSEARRLEDEEKRKKEMEAAARVQRDEQHKREAEQRAANEQERKRADEQARREAQGKKAAEAQAKADAERARREADARSKAEAQKKAEQEATAAQRRREEEARRSEEARKAEEARRLAAAAPKAPAASATPGAALLAQAEQACARASDADCGSLYRKAANAGNAEAQYRLGEMSAAGKGVSQSDFEAYVWFSLAANSGHAGAKRRRDQVVVKLQPAEIQQADRLIRARSQPGAPPKS